MTTAPTLTAPPTYPHLDEALQTLKSNADSWAKTTTAERIAMLTQIKEGLREVAPAWATTAAEAKQIPADSPLVGEEWASGPYAVMAACGLLIETLSGMEGRSYLSHLPQRVHANGQLVVTVTPHTVWDHLLFSGVHAEVWMKPGVTRENLAEHTASAFNTPIDQREGKVALVLGAGNIAAIAPLDCFQKLFSEHQVVVLKLNPVNEYLAPFLEKSLAPLIEFGALRIVKGGGAEGAYLCEHDAIDEIHITGSGATHDVIVWGKGAEGEANRKAGTPRLHKRITSELGAVCPTIVVPGPWNAADLSFQAEQIATQKLHNSGFNCVACQVLILPSDWDKTQALLDEVSRTMKRVPARGLYYPGAEKRLEDFAQNATNIVNFERPGSAACLVERSDGEQSYMETHEVFGPAMGTVQLPGTAEAYLRAAVTYANERLHGTLGANILIHPATIKEIGKPTFEAILADLHYGSIAVNAWTGLAFLLPQCTWGAFPGHTLDDVQSGIGLVHNTWMFDRAERSVVYAPFRPFPRTVLSGGMTMLPRPPWFVTNTRAAQMGEWLTDFAYKPGWLKLPRLFFHALQG